MRTPSRTARAVPAAAGLVAALVPVANAVAAPQATPASTTKTYTGDAVAADRWGDIVVAVTIKTTTTKVNGKATTTRKIVKLTVPTYPSHTDRSLYISQQAVPILFQEVLAAQSANVDMVSRATDTSIAFQQSLQSALTKAKFASAAATQSSATAA